MNCALSTRQAAFRPAAAKLSRRHTVCNATKLYTNPRSRGAVVQWYIEEIGAKDIEYVMLDMREKREHKSESYLKINPFGKVPALEDGDLKMSESGAILLYLAEKYNHSTTARQRAVAAQWILFSNSTLVQAMTSPKRQEQLPTILAPLNQLLSNQSFLAGNDFSVADVAVGSTLMYAPLLCPDFDLKPFPNVCAYVDRLKGRPANQKTVGAISAGGNPHAAKQ